MKTLLAIMTLSLLGTTALNSPPLREGPGEGAEQQPDVQQVFAAKQGNTLPLPLPQGRGVQNEPADNATTFLTIDIIIDPKGKPLGAYQFELTTKGATFFIVGIEAGEHAAFDHDRPPYYDRTADHRNVDRLIVGEYALPDLDAEALPTGPVRVATIHAVFDRHELAQGPITFNLKLTAAGDADAKPIDATATYRFRNPERSE